MSKFKEGPARIRDGKDAVVYEVCATHIFGRVGLTLFTWDQEGHAVGCESWADLIPPEPERVEFEVVVRRTRAPDLKYGGEIWSTDIEHLQGKRVRVTVEVIE